VKSVKIAVVLLSVLFLCPKVALSDDPSLKTGSNILTRFSQDKFSIGLNNLPWSAYGSVSLRWWDKDKYGSELILNTYSITYDPISYNYSLPSTAISYTWLDRKEISGVENMFFVKGMGVGISYYIYGSSTSRSGNISLAALFPVGIEHFFYSAIPNLSYSVEARFFGKLETSSPSVYSLTLGVSPYFYIHWYF